MYADISIRNLPNDMKESIASLVYAAPRCTDLGELKDIKDIFTKKYGKEFAAAVNELRPDCGVNRGVSISQCGSTIMVVFFESNLIPVSICCR